MYNKTMDTTRLKQINDENAQKALAQQQHTDLLSGIIQVSNTAIETTTSLIKYLEGSVSKVHVVNQLEEIGTPDALLVVDAINSLHATLQTHKDTDLTEVTSVMKAILEESKKIPKELPELKEREDKDYSDQLKSLESAVSSVEKVIKAQKLIAEAPIVNVAPTDVKVDAPDLKPLQTAIKGVVTAVNKIVIPEYKTDNKAVEELLKKSNKLLKEIVDKPVGGGGGGGGRVSPYQTGVNAPAFVTLEGDGSIPVTVVAGGGSSSSGKATDAYGIQAVSDDGTYKYFFFEDASLNYYIMRKTLATKVFTYTKGTGGYAAAYQSAILGPSGSPTFASYGTTF